MASAQLALKKANAWMPAEADIHTIFVIREQ
jgi:hypothetical protein